MTLLNDIKAKFAAHHADHPQRAGLAKLHLDSIEYALAGLAALGHRLHLEHSEDAPVLAFPQMIYKDNEQPMVVESSEERDAKFADGWRATPLAVPPMALADMLAPAPTIDITTKLPE